MPEFTTKMKEYRAKKNITQGELADMVLDALEQALHDRGMPKNVIHHSDRGVQYLSIRYTNRLEAANLRVNLIYYIRNLKVKKIYLKKLMFY